MAELADPRTNGPLLIGSAADDAEVVQLELRRFRVLAESSLVGIFQCDAEGNLIYINDCGAAIAGMSAQQAYGRGWVANLHPDDRDRVLAESNQARSEGKPFRSEYRFRHADGRIVWVLVRFIPDHDASGRLVGHVGTVHDITPLKQTEELLRNSERRYAALVEHSIPGIWHIDTQGSTLYLNPSMRRMLELDDGEPDDDLAANPSRRVFEFFTPEGREQIRLEHAKRQKGVASSYEVEVIGKKGGRRNVVICGAPLLTRGGKLESMIATFTDITDRKRMEEALRHNETRLRVMTEQVPAVLWTTDTKLRFTSSVGAGLTAMGLAAGQVVGMTVPQFLEQDPNFGEGAVDAHRHALLGISRTYEQAFNGRSYHCHVEPLRGADRAIQGVIGIALDVTDRKKAEDAVRDARDLLEIRVRQRTEGLKQAEARLLESTRRARESADKARAAAVREHLAAEEARQMAEFNRRLALEVDHRVRNNLAGLLSLVAAMRTTTRDVNSFAGAIEGRLVSMSHVHQLLAETDWREVDLRTLVSSLLAAAERLCPNKIDAAVEGPLVAVSPRQAPAISMILMEWFTNSCKYGAHTVPGGGLRVAWTIIRSPIPDGSNGTVVSRINLCWTESGGPCPTVPARRSLGTELVESFATVELQGSVQIRLPETGADHLLEFPLDASESARK